MENLVMIPLIILAILMAGIAALVAYLLYRPRKRKKKLKPEGPVSTEYAEPPENGDVKLNIPEDGTILPPYSSKGKVNGKPEETKVFIERPDDTDSLDEDKKLLEVKVQPDERPVDVGDLEKKAPGTSSDEDLKPAEKSTSSKESSTSSSSSSSDSDQETPKQNNEVPPHDKDSPKDPIRRSTSPVSSSSSTSSEEEVETPEPMPLMEPHVVRDPLVSKEDDPDLVSDVLAAVKEKQHKESSSSSSSSSDDEKKRKIDALLVMPIADGKTSSSSSSSSEGEENIPATYVEGIRLEPEHRIVREIPVKESPAMVATTSSDEDFDPAAERRKQPPKPSKRKKKPTPEKIAVMQVEKTGTSSSSSSSTEGEMEITPSTGLMATQTKKSSTSSSSSSESGDGFRKPKGEEISTQTPSLPSAMKRRKAKKYAQPLSPVASASTQMQTKSSTSSSSSSSEDDAEKKKITSSLYTVPPYAKRPLQGVPISTQTEKISSTSSSSSSSEDEIEFAISPSIATSTQTKDLARKRKKRDATSPTSSSRTGSLASSESERELYRIGLQGTPRVGPRPWSPSRGIQERPNSPQADRSTQTLFAPKTKKPKRTKSKEPVQLPAPIVITMTDKSMQTSKIAWTPSSSSSSEEKPIQPSVVHVYEKGNQMTSSSSSSSSEEDISIKTSRQVTVTSEKRFMVSTGTGTETPRKTPSFSPSSEKKTIQPSVVHVYEKGNQMTSSSSSSSSEEDISIKTSRQVTVTSEKRMMVSTGTGTETPRKTPSFSPSSERKPIQPSVVHVYEKGNQMTSSSSSSSEEDIGIKNSRQVTVTSEKRVVVSTGAGTETPRKSRKVVSSTALLENQHEVKTVYLEVQPEEQYKTETIVELPPEPKQIIFTTSWGKSVDLLDLYKAGIVDKETKRKLEFGELEPIDESVVRMVKPYISSNRPIAGILLVESGRKISIHEAAKRDLIRRGTALSLLEAEVATGGLIDPITGRHLTVDEAAEEGFIDRSYMAVLKRAESAVYGFKSKGSDHVLSIFEAMNLGIIVHNHGIRLLEAQLATGGIIDPRTNHRVPLEAAYRHKLFDKQMMITLENPSDDSKGFFDPNEKKNLTYLEIMSKCINDLETGILLLPLETRERGRSSASSVRSSTRIEMKSPSRSKSRERPEVFTLVVPSSSSSSSSSESDGWRKKKKVREIKTSSASIELSKTPVMSADDDESLAKHFRSERTAEIMSDVDDGEKRMVETVMITMEKDVDLPEAEEKKETRETSEAKINLTASTPVFQPITMTVKLQEEEAKAKSSSLSRSSSSSSSSDRGEIKVEETEQKAVEVKHLEQGGESSSSTIITTKTVVTTTEVLAERRRSRHEIKFKSGWNRQASLADLFAAGVISKETVNELEEGTIQEEDVEKTLHHYLVGEEPISGILLSESGEKMTIYAAWRKGLIRRGTSISLLEAQAATGRILDPTNGERMSVTEASKKKLIDRSFESVLSRAERAVFGYTTRLTPDVLSLFQAMKRGLVVENHGIRLLEAQIATGGIIDPNANHRLPVEVAYERGLFDERINKILEDPGDDTRGFFDPNTEENLTYLELMERCVVDKDTGMRLLPLRLHKTPSKKSKVVFESRTGRQVTLNDLLHAEVLDGKTAQRFEVGEMSKQETEIMVAKLKVFVDGTMPIAGVINSNSGERMSFYEADKSGLVRRGTAFELLEAQACCGKLIDVQTGRVVTIETALRSGVIDREFKEVVERAHRAVTGYREPFKRDLLSLCEAMNRHLIVRRHGIRLLEAQIATGGIVDIRSPVRINVQVALKRTLIDSKLADELEQKLTQSYYDPITGENLNYSELMGRCVTDKDTGLLYLMVEGDTITGYVRPFEPEHSSKIRSQSMSPAKITTEEVATKRSRDGLTQHSTLITTETHTEASSSKRRKKRKTKSSKQTTSYASSTGSESNPSTPSSPSIISRRVIIMDPDTNEELSVQDALSKHLIDEETARQLISTQGDFEEKEEL